MGFRDKLSLFIENWSDGIPILLSSIFIYFLFFLIGSLATLPLSSKFKSKSSLSSLFVKLFTGTTIFLFFVSLYYTSGRSINIILLVSFVFVYILNKREISFKSIGIIDHISFGLKSFLFCIPILIFVLLFKMWMFDFFNPARTMLWVDFTYYTSIFQKMGIEHYESSIYGLPGNFTDAPYTIYHYSDLWISKGTDSIIPLTSNSDIYTYVFGSVSSTIFLVGALSLVKFSTKKSSSFVIFIYLVLLSFLTLGIFVSHPPKTLLPEATIMLMVPYLLSRNFRMVFVLSILLVVLNPVYLFFAPFIFAIYIISKYRNSIEFRNKIKNNLKPLVIIFTIFCIAVVYFYIKFYIKINGTTAALRNNFMKDFVGKFKEYELLQILKVLFVVSLFYGRYLIKRVEFKLLIFAFLALLGSIIYKILMIENNNENWQVVLITSQVFYLFTIVFAINLMVKKTTYFNFKTWIIIAVLIFCGIQNYKTLYYETIRLTEYEGFPSFDKSLVASISKQLSCKDCNVGFYTKFKDEEPVIEEYHQGLRLNSFMIFAEAFRDKKMWTVPLFLHNRIDSISDNLKSSWKQTDYARYTALHQNKSEEQIFSEFVVEKNVDYLITDIDFRILPKHIKKSVKYFATYKPKEKIYTNYNLTFYTIIK